MQITQKQKKFLLGTEDLIFHLNCMAGGEDSLKNSSHICYEKKKELTSFSVWNKVVPNPYPATIFVLKNLSGFYICCI